MGETFIRNLSIMAQIMNYVSIATGIFLTMAALFEFKKIAEQRNMMQHHGAVRPVILLLCGAALLALPTVLGTALLSFWGQASDLAYPTSASTGFASLEPAVIQFIRLVGLGAFIRGIFLLSRTGGHQSQPGAIGKALIHMLAGVLCLHIMQTIALMKSILGVSSTF